MLYGKPVHTVILICAISLFTTAVTALHAGDIRRCLNQVIYVPLYSHIYADERYKDKPFQLTATLFIRDTDPMVKNCEVILTSLSRSARWFPADLLSRTQTRKAGQRPNFLSTGVC